MHAHRPAGARRRLARAIVACAILAVASPVPAGPPGPVDAPVAMRDAPVAWTIDGTRFEGVLVQAAAAGPGKRPGLVLVPNWRGIGPDAVQQARDLAGDAYVVLVADLYGAGVRPDGTDAARAASQPLREDRALMRERIRKAVEVLRLQPGVDPARVGALGFCFGGTAVLELARSGSDVAGVVSLHGGLSTPSPAAAGAVRAPVLVLNGAADAGVTDEDILAFKQEMDAAGADWQFVDFSGAVHCFAEPSAGDAPGNCRYDPRAAARAYRMLRGFFAERFAAGDDDQWSRSTE